MQSEFSLLTGLSSASFGSSAYYLFKQGAGRFHNTLPHALAALGYRTMLASSCRRNFLNYDEFYRSIGIGQRIFADDFPPPFDIRRFEKQALARFAADGGNNVSIEVYPSASLGVP